MEERQVEELAKVLRMYCKLHPRLAGSSILVNRHYNDRKCPTFFLPPASAAAMLRDVVTMFRTQPLEYDYWVEESMVSESCVL